MSDLGLCFEIVFTVEEIWRYHMWRRNEFLCNMLCAHKVEARVLV